MLTSLMGMGRIMLATYVIPLDSTTGVKTNRQREKKLFATTDFFDNIVINHRGSRYGNPVTRTSEYYHKHKCFMDKAQLDQLHRFLASIGVTRHQWIFDNIWTLYEDYPQGFDLLKEAVKSAHKYGIEFYAEIKPFEGGGFGIILPHTVPFPEGVPAFKDMRGIFPLARRFAAEKISMNLKRRPGTYECDSPVSAIRLVKSDDNPTRVRGEHLSLWTSPSNNEFIPYKGPLTFRETIEDRYRFPYWRKCRVFHLEELQIPPGHSYFLVCCSLADGQGDFGNEKGNIIELAGADGKVLPCILSTGPVRFGEHDESFYQSKVMTEMVRYLQLPEVKAEIDDLQKMEKHYRSFYSFGEYSLTDWITLDKEGFVAAASGKPEYMLGNQHPIYPDVRKYWLEMVRFCLDREVDGINFRASNHTNSPEYWDYAFNEPVIKAAKGKTDYPTISSINGDSYTLFLREARELIKKRGKGITIHLNSEMLMPDNRIDKLNGLPPNFQWQWKTWVKEIADDLEFRGVFKLRPWNLDKVLDIFGKETRAANKPFYFQGDFHGLDFERPFMSTKAELELVNKHDALDGYVLYETANFTRVNDEDKVVGSPELIKVLKNYL
jgi:hypothetical protein